MEIKISKSSKACAASERPFEHDEELVSLVRVVDGDLVREDYARDAWEPAYAEGAYSVWHTRFYDPQVAEAESPEVFSPLRQLFYEAVESDDRIELAKAYLAGQLLRRQKVFRQIKESDESEGDTRITLFADRIGDRLIEVRDPQFTHQELEEGRKRLLDRLQELEGAEAAESATAAGEADADGAEAGHGQQTG